MSRKSKATKGLPGQMSFGLDFGSNFQPELRATGEPSKAAEETGKAAGTTATAGTVTLKNISSKAKPARESVYLVLRDGVPSGVVSKFKDDRYTCNPWKAFRGVGIDGKFVGTFYDAESLKKFYGGMPPADVVKDMKFGGKQAAIDAALGQI